MTSGPGPPSRYAAPDRDAAAHRHDDTLSGTGADLLETGPTRRAWPWLVLAALVVAALVAWNVAGDGREVPRAADPPPVERPVPTEVEPGFQPTPDRAELLTYADEQTGFLVQWVCSEFSPAGDCPRQVLATDDGGTSWEARGRLPEAARYLDRFVVDGATLAFVGEFGPAAMAVSYDAGRTFTMRALDRAAAAPAPDGAPVVTDSGLPCPEVVCPPALAWVDIEAATVHPLPGRLDAGGLPFLRVAARPADGDLVVGAVGVGVGLVWVSADGGTTWRESRLAAPSAPRQAVTDVTVLAAGAGRAFAFVQVFDSTGLAQTYGYRTDDGGATWTGIGFDDQSLWLPAGVVAGQLISTNNPGAVYLSDPGGRDWRIGGPLPAPAYLTQTLPDGPVLATIVGQNGLQTFYQSIDGLVWDPVPVPPPPPG